MKRFETDTIDIDAETEDHRHLQVAAKILNALKKLDGWKIAGTVLSIVIFVIVAVIVHLQVVSLNLLRGNVNVLSPAPAPLTTDCQATLVSRNIKYLTSDEKLLILKTWKKMKSVASPFSLNMTYNYDTWYKPRGDPQNAYDYFVAVHNEAVVTLSEVHSNYQFLPWHRELIKRMHSELRRISGDPCIVLPYWDFEDEDSWNAMMDLSNFIGGNGSPGNNYKIEEGQLAGEENFPMYINPVPPFNVNPNAPYLQRAIGNGKQMCLDQNNNGWQLDCPDNPPNVMEQPLVGPILYMPVGNDPNSGPAASNNGVLMFKPIRTTPSDCAWQEEEATCLRYFTGTDDDGTTFNITCKHYGSTLAVEGQFDICQQYPFLPMENTSRLGKWDDWQGQEIVPSSDATAIDAPQTALDGSTFFRACIEGVNVDDPYASVAERGGAALSYRHGRAHTYIGGAVSAPTSPNDPIFWLLHMNVNRLWAEMQEEIGFNDDWTQSDAYGYGTKSLFAFEATPEDMISTVALGYTFDTIIDDSS